jgi:predicted alpha/beta superfamily hydrolase
LLAAYASFRHPGVFGKKSLQSASFWYDRCLDFMRGEPVTRGDRTWQARPVDRTAHRLYMYVGELEGVYKRTVQRDMVARTKEARAVLLAQGMPPERLKLETDANGTHDAFFFTGRFMNAMQWLFAERGAADA